MAVAAGLSLTLASTDARAGSSLKLSEPLLPGEGISQFTVLPNGQGVVYQSGDDFDEPADILVAPINGGSSTLLSGTLARTYGSSGFVVTPDSGSVLMWINLNSHPNNQDLYRVPTTGGIPVPLIERFVPEQPPLYSISLEGFNAAGDRLIYSADYTNSYPATASLYSIPTAGGAPSMISAPLGEGETVSGYYSNLASPDNPRFVYGVGSTNTYHASKLISASPDGASFATLTDGIDVPLYSRVGNVHFTPDGSKVVFDTERAVYVNSVLGGTPQQLSDLSTYDLRFQTTISPDGESIVYKDYYSMYSVPISGGVPVKLHDATRYSPIWGISPDSSRVITELDDTRELYSVPIGGGDTVALSEGAAGFLRIVDSPEGARVLYSQSGMGLYSVKMDGTDRVLLNAPLAGSVIHSGLTTPDGRFVVFGADVGDQAWYAVPIDGGTPVRISQSLYYLRSYEHVELTPDGSKLVYLDDHDVPNRDELYVAGIPLAHVDAGSDVAGGILGGAGFGGGLDFQFDDVATAGTLTAEYFRTPLDELDPNLAQSIGFALPGDVLNLWDLSYTGTFSGSVSLTFTYDEALLGAGVSESSLAIMHQLAGGGWEKLATLARDLAAHTITVEVSSFSNFTVGVVPEPSSFVLLSLALAGLFLCRHSRRRC